MEMTRSVEELRQESERNRAELAATVERLKQGISDTTRDLRHMRDGPARPPSHAPLPVGMGIEHEPRNSLDDVS